MALELTPFEAGYISGMVDGEGCLGIYTKSRTYHQGTLEIKNTNSVAMQHLAKLIGKCSLRVKKLHHERHHDIWVLTAGEKQLAQLLPQLHLIVKREQKVIMLSYLQAKRQGNREQQREMALLMRQLNHRGKPSPLVTAKAGSLPSDHPADTMAAMAGGTPAQDRTS